MYAQAGLRRRRPSPRRAFLALAAPNSRAAGARALRQRIWAAPPLPPWPRPIAWPPFLVWLPCGTLSASCMTPFCTLATIVAGEPCPPGRAGLDPVAIWLVNQLNRVHRPGLSAQSPGARPHSCRCWRAGLARPLLGRRLGGGRWGSAAPTWGFSLGFRPSGGGRSTRDLVIAGPRLSRPDTWSRSPWPRPSGSRSLVPLSAGLQRSPRPRLAPAHAAGAAPRRGRPIRVSSRAAHRETEIARRPWCSDKPSSPFRTNATFPAGKSALFGRRSPHEGAKGSCGPLEIDDRVQEIVRQASRSIKVDAPNLRALQTRCDPDPRTQCAVLRVTPAPDLRRPALAALVGRGAGCGLARGKGRSARTPFGRPGATFAGVGPRPRLAGPKPPPGRRGLCQIRLADLRSDPAAPLSAAPGSPPRVESSRLNGRPALGAPSFD